MIPFSNRIDDVSDEENSSKTLRNGSMQVITHTVFEPVAHTQLEILISIIVKLRRGGRSVLRKAEDGWNEGTMGTMGNWERVYGWTKRCDGDAGGKKERGKRRERCTEIAPC